MTDKREWYQAEYWSRHYEKWSGFQDELDYDSAKATADKWRANGYKTRIVRHTTEVVKEREPQAERKDGER